MATSATNHSTPRTGVNCRQCQRTNSGSRRFCGGCGKSLWEQCPQCQAECAVDERFCGQCGADVQGGIGAQAQDMQERIERAEALAQDHRYEAAISALRFVAEALDPRFGALAAKATAKIATLEEQFRLQREVAAAALAQASQLLQACAFERAQEAIEAVPEPLRTSDHLLVWQRAKSCRQELLKLSGEIRRAVELKQTDALLPKLHKLLALKPNHIQARQLADAIRDRLVKTAQASLTKHRYRDALDVLEQIPAFCRNEQVLSLCEEATELDSLLSAVRGAALADRTLLALADRLSKLAPSNPEVAAIRTQIAERMKLPPAEPPLGAPNWSPVPVRSVPGPPVDWLAHLKRPARASAVVTQALDERPGQFFTAFGLALAGLGLGAIGADLTPQSARPGVLGMLPSLPFGKRPSKEAWGLDFSDHALKAVKLRRVGKADEFQLEQVEYLPHSASLTNPETEHDRAQVSADTLQRFRDRAGELKTTTICAGLPGQRVLGRFFELPPMPAKKVGSSIRFEIQHQLPIALDELCWSHEILDEQLGKEADACPRRIFVQAAREAHVSERIALFKAAGIGVDLVQSDCVALHNALVVEHLSTGGDAESGAIAAIDVGAEATSVVVSSPRSVWFRTFSQGGNSFTRELVRQHQLTYDQAEHIKREPAQARRFSELEAALRPLVGQMAGEIERSLTTYARTRPDCPVRRVYGLGGGFQTHGLLRFLRTGK